MAEAKKPAVVEYENIKSGARISGTLYNSLNKRMKAKYTKVKAAKKSKKADTPAEAK